MNADKNPVLSVFIRENPRYPRSISYCHGNAVASIP